MDQRTVDKYSYDGKRRDIPEGTIPGLSIRVGGEGKTYFLRYRNDEGKQQRAKLGSTAAITLMQARQMAREILGTVAGGADPIEDKRQTKAEAITLGAYLPEHYAPWLESQTRTGKNIVRFITNWLVSHMDKPLKDLTTLDLERIRREMKAKGNTPATANRFIEHTGAMLRRAMEWGMLAVMPKMPKRDRLDNGKTRILIEDERTRLFAALRARDLELREARARHITWARERGYMPVHEHGAYVDHLEPAILLALSTGGRRAEVLGCKWCEIDMEQMIWTIPASRAKSAKSRIIPLNKAAQAVITNMRNISGSSPWVFPNEAGDGPILDLRKSFDKVLESAGIKDFNWHALRHCFISNLVESGVDLETCRSLSGHSNLEVLQRYTHSTDVRRKDAVAVLDALNDNTTPSRQTGPSTQQ